MKHSAFILSVIALVLISCKPKVSPLAVYTTIEDLNWQTTYAKGNYNYQVKTTAQSNTGAVRHVVITTFDAKNLNKTIVDTVLQDPVKNLTLLTVYCTPMFEDTTNVKFTTTVYSTDGESANFAFSISVLPSEAPLQPVDGVTMYSALSGGNSYFSLTRMQPVMAVDSGEVYFYDVAPKDSSDILSGIWTSPMIYFSRSESFDYAKATASSIRSTYQSCTKDHTITKLKVDDVLLFGTATDAMGVLKIMVIEDKEGRINDRYVFSLKALPKK